MVGTRRLKELTAGLAATVSFPPDGLVVALSGGADSAALAYLAAPTGRARAIHVHHGLSASDRLASAATAAASALGLTFEVRSVTVRRWSEGAARNERYRALLGALEPEEWLLTAHTADDQAETVLANLLRGSGVTGLAGIPPRRPPLARPLLGVERAATRELATLARLPWVDDPTNADPGPLRNRLRRRLLPQLEAEYNPAVRQHLAEVAQITSAFGEDEKVPAEHRDGAIRLPVPMLEAVPRRQAVRSLQEALRPWRHGYGFTRAEFDRLWAVVERRMVATEIAGGLRAERSGPWLIITRQGTASPPPAKEWALPGSMHWGGFRFEAIVTSERPSALPLSPWLGVFDLDRVGEVLTVEAGPKARPRVRSGDRVIWEPGRWRPRSGWIDGATRRYLSTLCEEEAWHR